MDGNPAYDLQSVLGFMLSTGYTLQTDAGGVVVQGPEGQMSLPLPTGLADTLADLRTEPVSIVALASKRPTGGLGQFENELLGSLEQLARLGALRRVVIGKDGPIAVVEPLSEYYRLKEASEPPLSQRLRLSRFSYLRSDGGMLVLESPLCHARVLLNEPAVAVTVARLAQPHSAAALLQYHPVLSEARLMPVLALLLAEEFIAPATETGEAAIDDTLPLRQWEFHDLLFHSRTRFGRHRNPIGGNFRFCGRIDPLPAVKPRMSFTQIPLPRPSLPLMALSDAPLTTVLESRASVRKYGNGLITLPELGTFLYRAARIRQLWTFGGIEITNRPYPNGGASYELEIYPIIARCQDLLSGLYHYDPAGHQLEPLLPANELTEKTLNDAWVFCGCNTRPEVLLMITARFQRVSWKYQSIAYATILKNVGALYQTMYLVATAMGLAPCALGCGNSDRFNQLLGVDYYEETAVGEFMLGNLRSLP